MRYRLRALLPPLLLLLPAMAAAQEPLACRALSQTRCEGPACVTVADPAVEVRFQPEPTPVSTCRALTCPSDLPTIAYCDLTICGQGTVHYQWRNDAGAPSPPSGIAYIAPEPPPALYASMHFALSFESGSGRLALSRFDGGALVTTWLLCAAPGEGG